MSCFVRELSKRAPRVSVAMPTFNRAGLVAESIRGVLAQTFTDYEFLIHDDGSRDGTADVVRGFADPRMRLVVAQNEGPPHPLRHLLARASGEYLIVMHDHDLFAPTLIEKSVAALDAHPTAGFVLQGSAWMAEDGRSGRREMLLDLPAVTGGPDFLRELLLRPKRLDSPFHACAMIRMKAFRDVGLYYDTRSGWYADVELTFRLLARFDFVYLREVLYSFREREQGHVLSRRIWETFDELEEIHAGAIRRAFDTGDPRSSTALASLRHKLWFNRRNALVSIAAAGDEAQLVNGLRRFRSDGAPRGARLLGYGLARFAFGRAVFMRLARVARSIKRRATHRS